MWSTWPTTTRQTGTLGRWGRKAPRPVRAPLRATGGVAPYPHPPGGVPRPRGLVARSSWAGEAPALLLGLARRPLGTARHHSVTGLAKPPAPSFPPFLREEMGAPSSAQAADRSLPGRPESSFPPLGLLSPPNPLRWASAGAPITASTSQWDGRRCAVGFCRSITTHRRHGLRVQGPQALVVFPPLLTSKAAPRPGRPAPPGGSRKSNGASRMPRPTTPGGQETSPHRVCKTGGPFGPPVPVFGC